MRLPWSPADVDVVCQDRLPRAVSGTPSKEGRQRVDQLLLLEEKDLVMDG